MSEDNAVSTPVQAVEVFAYPQMPMLLTSPICGVFHFPITKNATLIRSYLPLRPERACPICGKRLTWFYRGDDPEQVKEFLDATAELARAFLDRIRLESAQ